MSYTKSYFKYIKEQNPHVKNVHSIVIASVLTFIFAVAYLYIMYGITPPAPSVNISTEKTFSAGDSNIINIQNDTNNKNSIEIDNSSPFSSLYSIFKNVKDEAIKAKDGSGEIKYKAAQ